jgi:hypothetical protein
LCLSWHWYGQMTFLKWKRTKETWCPEEFFFEGEELGR